MGEKNPELDKKVIISQPDGFGGTEKYSVPKGSSVDIIVRKFGGFIVKTDDVRKKSVEGQQLITPPKGTKINQATGMVQLPTPINGENEIPIDSYCEMFPEYNEWFEKKVSPNTPNNPFSKKD